MPMPALPATGAARAPTLRRLACRAALNVAIVGVGSALRLRGVI